MIRKWMEELKALHLLEIFQRLFIISFIVISINQLRHLQEKNTQRKLFKDKTI